MKVWITGDTWKAIEERSAIKHRCYREPDSTKKEELRKEYKQKDRAVKKKSKREGRKYVHEGHRGKTGLQMTPGRPYRKNSNEAQV